VKNGVALAVGSGLLRVHLLQHFEEQEEGIWVTYVMGFVMLEFHITLQRRFSSDWSEALSMKSSGGYELAEFFHDRAEAFTTEQALDSGAPAEESKWRTCKDRRVENFVFRFLPRSQHDVAE